MPNWCSNAIETKDERILARFRKVAEKGQDGTLFEEFFPMPEELRSIHRGSAPDRDGNRVRAWRVIDGENVGVTEAEEAELLEKYGAVDWYDWSINNFGTKWDADISDLTLLPDGTGRINFDTAWSPPERFVQSLSEMYPEAYITLTYCEQGMGFWGLTTYHGGSTAVEWMNDGGIYKTDLPDDAWDYMDEHEMLQPDCANFLAQHGLGTGG